MDSGRHIGPGALAFARQVSCLRHAATRMTMSIGVAVLVVMATVVLALVSTVSPAVKLSADSTALIMGGSTIPTPDDAYMAAVQNQYIAPTHPGQGIDYVAVTTPEESWPLSGLLRLLGSALGPPSIWGPGGPGWPDEPWWKLSGLFDLTLDQSNQAGVADLEKAMAAHGNNDLVIYGYSTGAVIANLEKRKLAEQYPAGTTAPNIDFVLQGDLNLPNGGFFARFPGLHIPIIDWSFNGPAPTDTQFDTVEINRQYDFMADFPLYPLNPIADLNALLGFFYVHMHPFDVSLPADPTTSPAYQGTHGDTSYYFFPTQDLPLFAPLRSLGVPESLIDVVEPFFRVIVELGYDRSIPPWQPTPARLIPQLDPAKVTADLVNAIGEGINNALALVGSPAPPSSPTPSRAAALGPVDAAPKTANAGISAQMPVSEPAAQPDPLPSTAPAATNSSAPTGPVAQQEPAASTALAAQTSPTVSTEPTAQQEPTVSTALAAQTSPSVLREPTAQHKPAASAKPATQQNPVALNPASDNASEPSVKPKPSATAATPTATKPAGRPVTQRPAGQPRYQVALPRTGQPTTAGSNSDGAPKPGSSSSTPSGGSSSTTSSARGSSPEGGS